MEVLPLGIVIEEDEYFSALNLVKEMHAVSLTEEYQIWVGGLAEDETGGALSSRRSQGEASL